ATSPPFRQSMVQASVTRFHRSEPDNPMTKSGFAFPAMVSRVAATAPGLVTKVPIGSGWPAESRGTLPQIHVVSPPGLMKLRPKAAPNDPGAGKRGTNDGKFRI